MLELVQGYSERGTIEIVTFPGGSAVTRIFTGGLVFEAFGAIPAAQFARWLDWLKIPVEYWTRKEI